jgi:hypothetical protein
MLIEVDSDRGLTMTATDMDIGIVASTQEVEILEEGKVLVNVHYFNDFIKLLPDGIITIELNLEASKLSINYGRSSGFINIYRDFEYPHLPLEKMEKRMELPQSILREALRKTSFAAAFNHFRQVFTGVLFDCLFHFFIPGRQYNYLPALFLFKQDCSFIYAIVYYFEYQVMKTFGASGTYVHTWPFSHCFQAF